MAKKAFISLYSLLYEANELSKTEEEPCNVFICKDGNNKYFASIDGLWRTKSIFKSRESIIYHLNLWKSKANFKFNYKEV